MKTHQTQHAETPDDLIGYFDDCTTNPVFWCAVCQDCEVLAHGEACPDCRADAQVADDAAQVERVSTTVRHLQPGDVLTSGGVILALGPVTRDRHVTRHIRAVQMVGQDYSKTWNAATTLTVTRRAL